MSEAEHIAPTLCQLLHQIATKEQPEEKEKVRKDHSLASSKLFTLREFEYLSAP
jgi:hypothetical protein